MSAGMHIGIEGHFRIVAIRPDGTERVLADWFKNLILDAGLNRMGNAQDDSSGAGFISGCAVGTGNSTPTITQTSLDNRIAWSVTLAGESIGVNSSVSPYYGWRRLTYRFAQGVAQGNLSEVGVGWHDGTVNKYYSGLYSRALILDGVGQPTTITVLSDEILDVTYEHRVYVPLEDVTGQITLNGVEYSYTIRAANVSSGTSGNLTLWRPYTLNYPVRWWQAHNYNMPFSGSNGSIQSIFQTITNGTQLFNHISGGYSYSLAAYVNNSYMRSIEFTLPYTSANFNISAMYIHWGDGDYPDRGWGGAYQIGFSPGIAKDNTLELKLTFSLSWARRT